MRRHVLIGLVVLAVTGIACGGTEVTSSSTKSKEVIYEITGQGTPTASITYGHGSDTSQENDVPLPWKKALTDTGDLIVPTVSAQSGSDGSGTISCKITVDCKIVKENTSTGAFAVVTCTAEGV